MLNLIRNESGGDIAWIKYSRNVFHMDNAIQKVVIDLHVDNILPDGRVIEVCSTRGPVNYATTPLVSLRLVRKFLTGKCHVNVHKLTLLCGKSI